MVPLAEGFIGENERIFAWGTWGIVPEATGAFIGPMFLVIGAGVIPNLHLGDPAKINSRVCAGNRLIFYEELEVSVILFGGGVGSLAVIDELGVFIDPPVWFGGFGVDLSQRLRPAIE